MNPKNRNQLAFFTVYYIAFLDWMGIGIVYPMFSSMFFSQGTPLFLATSNDFIRGCFLGVMLASMPLAQFFSSYLWGSLSDKTGRRPILMGTVLLASFGYLLSAYGVIRLNLVLLLLGRIVVGVASGNVSTANAVISDLSDGCEKTKRFGTLNMVAGLGFMVGPFLGGKLSDSSLFRWGGFDKPFLFSALLAFINFFLLVIFFKESLQKSSDSAKQDQRSESSVGDMLKKSELRSLLLTVLAFGFGWAFYWEFIPITWIKEWGLNASGVGNIYAFAAAIYALSSGLLIQPITSRYAPHKILFFALVFVGFYLLAISTISSPLLIWPLIALQQFSVALIFPVSATIASNLGEKKTQGRAMGLYQMAHSLSFGLSPLLSGTLVGLSHYIPYYVGGASMLLASLIFGVGWAKELFSEGSSKTTEAQYSTPKSND